MKKIEDVVTSLAHDAMRQRGLEILDVELSQGCLRVTLDSETPLDLDRVSEASAVVSLLVDGSEEFDRFGPFTLEVSSPGIERTLKTGGHFERFLGSKVSIKTKPDFEGPRRITGIIKEVGQGFVVLSMLDINPDTSLDTSSDLKIKFGDMDRARTVFEWNSPKPPKQGAKKQIKTAKLTDKKIAKG